MSIILRFPLHLHFIPLMCLALSFAACSCKFHIKFISQNNRSHSVLYLLSPALFLLFYVAWHKMWNVLTESVFVAMKNSSIENWLWRITWGLVGGWTLISFCNSPINCNSSSQTIAENNGKKSYYRGANDLSWLKVTACSAPSYVCVPFICRSSVYVLVHTL